MMSLKLSIFNIPMTWLIHFIWRFVSLAAFPCDEPIAPQDGQGDMSSDNSNIAAGNSLISSDLQFGAILFDEKYGKNMEKFTSSGLSSNILFRGVNCRKKEEEKKKRKYIYIGSYASGH